MTVKIHGNEYVTVVERMELMRASSKPFEIVESLPIQVGDRCVWRVAILLDGCKFYGSAECHFNAKPGTADATDPFACAETSAIGRALGFAGFGSVDSIASADEIVRNQAPAAKQAEAPIPINAPTPRELRERHGFLGMKDVFETIKYKMFKKSLDDDALSPEQCIAISGVLERFYEKQTKSA